jgi:hypothetical protein
MVKIDRMDSKLLAGLGLISVMSLRQVNADTMLTIISSLSLLQLLMLKIRGSLLIDWVRLEGWKRNLPFYIIKCPIHGYQLSYPSGYNDVLICPKCVGSSLG